MGVSLTTRQAYSEIDEFLGLLTEEQREKIPRKLREFFREEKDNNYIKGIRADIPVNEQNFKEETLAIIALLNLQYWCQDENEKQRLKSIYANNEKVYQEMLQVKFNPDDIFKKRNMPKEDEITEQTNSVAMIKYKEPLIKRIINKIKDFFFRR